MIYSSTLPLKIIPGKQFELPISINDEFNNEENLVYHVTIENHNKSLIMIDEVYSCLYGRQIKVFGKIREA